MALEPDSDRPDIVGKLAADMMHVQKELPRLQNGLSSLKGRITSLSNELESLKLSEFQEQITRLSERMDKYEASVLWLTRFVALLYIDAKLDSFVDIIQTGKMRSEKHEAPWLPSAVVFSDRQKFELMKGTREHLLNMATNARGRIQESDKPIPIATDFNISSQAYLTQQGFDFSQVP